MKSRNWIIIMLAIALAVVSVRLAVVSGNSQDSGDAEKDAVSGATARAGQDAIECIMTRTSVRTYADRAVPDSIIEVVLRAGMAAPTAMNKQPWHFYVVTTQAVKDSITDAFKFAKMVKDSAFVVVVCGDMGLAMESDTPERGNWVLDCSAASENMLLAAHAVGLGGVWCGVYPDNERVEALSRILDLPANIEPMAILSFGYPTAPTTPKEKWNPAKVTYVK